ncbi:DUF58 domain-containing protein [Stieleria sp. JC731]|uniref:DUF58 domain-containing protein n=1 Tax=Pirellulaceae TaxID=2691357 RepID=UPI001E3B9524|nr:DUF58 domain-containing protein [Stieleria sp. JC731]MCC9604059.1 DUF58 domain-containing protein [Stieleria sp. JC731]
MNYTAKETLDQGESLDIGETPDACEPSMPVTTKPKVPSHGKRTDRARVNRRQAAIGNGRGRRSGTVTVVRRVRFRDRLSRLGLHFLFVALFAIIGGSLRGFNLLLLLAGLLISVVIVQWRSAHAAIRRVVVSRKSFPGGHVGSELAVRYQVQNQSSYFPASFIQIEDRLVPYGVSEDDESWTVYCAVGTVAAKSTVETVARCRFANRGVFTLGPVVASTTFPFALTSSERMLADSQQVVYLYPRLLVLRDGWHRLLPPRSGGDGDRSTSGTNYFGSFYGLRPWQSGDHVRHIHWRTTARIGEPAVRQFEQNHRHQICLIVDGVIDGGGSVEGFEQVLSLAATMIDELSKAAIPLTLLVADLLSWEANSADPIQAGGLERNHGTDCRQMLERLAVSDAVVAIDERDPLIKVITESAKIVGRYDLVVISQRRFRDVMHPASELRTRQRSMPDWVSLMRRGRLTWLDIRSDEVRQYVHFADQSGNSMARTTPGRQASLVNGSEETVQ